MTLEYILLMSIFVLLAMGSLMKGPTGAFRDAAPKLAVRVEKNLITGDQFSRANDDNKKPVWIEE